MRKSAIFSEDRVYRYVLWRTWDFDKPYLMFVGLNPSTADETKDDPTIRRCVRFAKDLGYGGICMVNLFAFRATKPEEMKNAMRPVGKENNKWLVNLAKDAGMVIAAWGTNGTHLDRDKIVCKLVENEKDIFCLGITKDGQPKHPLYLRADTKPERY